MSALTHVYGVVSKGSVVPNASTSVLAANSNRNFLLIQNSDAALTIGVRLDGGIAVLNAQGTITLAPGATMLFDVAVPMGAITAISGGAGAQLTIYEG